MCWFNADWQLPDERLNLRDPVQAEITPAQLKHVSTRGGSRRDGRGGVSQGTQSGQDRGAEAGSEGCDSGERLADPMIVAVSLVLAQHMPDMASFQARVRSRSSVRSS